MNENVLFDTKFLQLKSAVSPSGKPWYYAHRPNAGNVVVILPLIDTNEGQKVLFIRELRPPLYAEGRGKYNIGLPAGLVGDERKDETILDAIKAELLEETGLEADRAEICAENISSSAGSTSECSIIAISFISNPKPVQEPISDGGVIVERIMVDIKAIPEFLKTEHEKGNTISGQALAALYFLK